MFTNEPESKQHKCITLAFIKSDYVRDAQAFTGKKVNILEEDLSSQKNEAGWRDCFGPILIGAFPETTEEQARELVKIIFPEAAEEIFFFQTFAV